MILGKLGANKCKIFAPLMGIIIFDTYRVSLKIGETICVIFSEKSFCFDKVSSVKLM